MQDCTYLRTYVLVVTTISPFSQLVSDEPDLEPDTVKHMFTENVMKLSPNTLTDNGFRCFDRFFRHVNHNDHKLRQWRRTLMTDRLDLLGLDYLWEVILTSQQGIANKAIELMKEIYTSLTPQLKEHNVSVWSCAWLPVNSRSTVKPL